MNKLLEKVERAVNRQGFVVAIADAVLDRVVPKETALAYDICFSCQPNCMQKCCWLGPCGYCYCDWIPCQPC